MPQKRVMNAKVVMTAKPILNCHSELGGEEAGREPFGDAMFSQGRSKGIEELQTRIDARSV